MVSNSENNNNPKPTEAKTNPTYDPEDRIQNANRLAKSLSTYLTKSPIKKKQRGALKDPRITQLNAAYKYIIHLESKLTNICDINNNPIPDDCKLLHNTNIQMNYQRLQNSDMTLTPNTPTHRDQSDSSNKQMPMCSSSSSNSGLIMPLKDLRGFENIDASPIMGNENHFFADLENFNEFGSDILQSTSTQNFESPSRKRKLHPTLISTSMQSTQDDKENTNQTQIQFVSKACSSRSSLQIPLDSDCTNNLGVEESSGRQRYFLRSTTRLKNMLMANNTVSNSPIASKMHPNSKKKILKGLDSSMCSSTRSTSITTTPSVPNSNMSTNSSTEFDTLDPKHLIKLNLSQEQIAQLYQSNQLENLNSKKTFHFV